MFSIYDNRRISGYVIQKSRQWLYEHLSDYCTDAHEASRNLSADIKAEGKISEESYNEFFSYFDNNPFSARMLHSAESNNRTNIITSEKLYCYFVKYNGVIMPMGFITEFFEDDFCSEEDKDKLFHRFLDYAKSETVSEWNKIRYEGKERLALAERRLDFVNNINIPLSFVKSMFALICTLFALVQSVIFSIDHRVWQVLWAFVRNGFRLRSEINVPIPGLDIANYTLFEYFRSSTVLLITNALVFFIALIIIFTRIIPSIKYIRRCNKTRSAISKRKHFILTYANESGDKPIRCVCDDAIRIFLKSPENILSEPIGHTKELYITSLLCDLTNFDYGKLSPPKKSKTISILCLIIALSIAIIALLFDTLNIISIIKNIM